MQKNPEIQAKIQADAIDFIYRNNNATEILLLILPFAFALEGINFLSKSVILYWLLTMLLIVFIRNIILWTYKKRSRPPIKKAIFWGYVYAGIAFMTGASWGVTSILFYLPEYPYHMVFLLVNTMALGIGSIATSAYWMPAFHAYLFPVGLPLCIYLMLSDGLNLIILGGLGTLLVIVALFLGHELNNILLQSIALRYENADLLHNFKQEKERVEKAYQANNRFLAAASHDLRQPLHALTLYLEPLVAELHNQKQLSLVNKARHSAQSLTELLNAILDISRLDVNAINPNLQAVNIEHIFKQLEIEFKPQFQEKNLKFRVRPLNIWVKTDPIFSARLLRNLLINAWRFTNSGGVLLVARKRQGKCYVEIWDTGIGISKTDLDKIFAEYVQLNNPERDRNKGLGLGLAIVQRLAQLLQLDLNASSQLERGSCFSVGFDITKSPTVSTQKSVGNNNIQGLTVLLIDDDKEALDATIILLNHWGCDTLAIYNPKKLYQMLQTWHKTPQVIISDYRLPNHQTGLDMIANTRQYFQHEIPALIISGDTSGSSWEAIHKQGLPALPKPVSPARLRAFLGRVRLHQKT